MRSMFRQYWNIQAVASDCSSSVAGRQVRAVERADVVEAQEPAREEVVAFLVLPVQPPREVEQQLVEDPLEEVEVAAPVDRSRRGRPRQHGQAGSRRRTTIRRRAAPRSGAGTTRDRAAGAGTSRTPGRCARTSRRGTRGPRRRTTGIPTGPASTGCRRRRNAASARSGRLPLGWRRRQARVAVEPAGDVVAVVLLAPEHPGEGLAHDQLLRRRYAPSRRRAS